MSKLLSTQEAAAMLGVNRQRVAALIRTGQLKAQRIGSYWAIEESSVRERIAQEPTAGRPAGRWFIADDNGEVYAHDIEGKAKALALLAEYKTMYPDAPNLEAMQE